MNAATASSVINRLNEIFASNGFPQLLLTDKGPPWKSKLIKSYFKSHGIKHQHITPLWPRANGLTKRSMQSIGKRVRTAVVKNRNWTRSLQQMLMNY